MEPRTLTRESFQAYPPLARKLACDHLELLRNLPIVLTAVLLREVIDFDARFPRERARIEARFSFLETASASDRGRLTKGFADLSLPKELIGEDWVRFPQKFGEDLSAHLWASNQLDAFRSAATQFAEEAGKATPPLDTGVKRWAVAVLGPELRKDGYPLFRKLRTHGVFYPRVEAQGGMSAIIETLGERASAMSMPYGHWYVDGGNPEPHPLNGICNFSWDGSSALRAEVLQKVQSVIGSGSGGPEMLRSIMATWAPDRHNGLSDDALVDQFVMSIYGEGSGTQIFSTTFVQWSAREILRRAEPASIVARFGPRQRQRSMNELFSSRSSEAVPDFAGSLVDADFGAYYTWINLNRLADSEEASFVAWSEAYGQAVAIGPSCPRGTEAANPVRLGDLIHA